MTDTHPARRASWRQLIIPEAGNSKETTMHPMFKELFIQTDADDQLVEEGRRRRASRTRRARSAMIIKPAARSGQRKPRP